MNLAASVKRAPRWAWFTVAGVGLGAGAIKLMKNRTTADGDTPADGSGEATTIGDPTYAGSGGATGVIVPPVVIGGNQDSGVATELTQAYLGAVGTTIDQMTNGYNMVLGKSLEVTDKSMGVTDQVSGLLSQTVGTLGDIASMKISLMAGAGGSPNPAAQYVNPDFAAAINRGDPNALAYVAAGAPNIDPAFAAKVAAGDPATLAFIRAHGG